MQAAFTIDDYLRKPPFDDCLTELCVALQKQIDAINKGDMKSAEGLLTAQAYTLDAIFHRLAMRSMHVESLQQYELDLKLALRAQNQCRATLETLSTIKNPPNVAFVRQANIANNQQINNGVQAGPPAAINSPPQLEHTDGNHLDTRTVTAASSDDPAMATVGEIHRT